MVSIQTRVRHVSRERRRIEDDLSHRNLSVGAKFGGEELRANGGVRRRDAVGHSHRSEKVLLSLSNAREGRPGTPGEFDRRAHDTLAASVAVAGSVASRDEDVASKRAEHDGRDEASSVVEGEGEHPAHARELLLLRRRANVHRHDVVGGITTGD